MDESLLCRLAVRWSVPLDHLDRELPHIRGKILRGEFQPEVNDEADSDPEDEDRAFFFFAFPLGEDSIVLVDSIPAFEQACSHLAVRAPN